jgi:general secretion pathway protein K
MLNKSKPITMPAMDKAKGSAILTALFIMTLVAIAATAISFRLQVEINRTQIISNSDKLYLASQSVPFWAMSVLYDAMPKDKNKIMKIKFPVFLDKNIFSDGGINIEGKLIDLQSRFNLNNLSNQKSLPQFINLLMQTNQKLKLKQAESIALATQQWILRQKPGNVDIILDQYYAKQRPPYLQAHQLMASISEWRLVKGVSQSVFNNTAMYLTALPTQTAINLNTASKPILRSLGIPNSLVDKLLEFRKGKLLSAKTLANIPELKEFPLPADQITFTSQFFLSQAIASTGSQQQIFYSTLQAKTSRTKKTVRIIKQSINSL